MAGFLLAWGTAQPAGTPPSSLAPLPGRLPEAAGNPAPQHPRQPPRNLNASTSRQPSRLSRTSRPGAPRQAWEPRRVPAAVNAERRLPTCGCCYCSGAALGEARSGNPGAGRLLTSPPPLGGPAQLVTQPSLKSPVRGLRVTLARKSWLSVSFPGSYVYKRTRLPGPRAGAYGPAWLRRVGTELPARRLSECGAEVGSLAPFPALRRESKNVGCTAKGNQELGRQHWV